MNPPRLLITGSRTFVDHGAVESTLADFRGVLAHPGAVLVSGGCPQGAETIAERVWRGWGLPVEVHPVDWSQEWTAVPERNARMVRLGADVCIGFVAPCSRKGCFTPGIHDSHGASGCLRLARAAGIPVVVVRPTPTIKNGTSPR